MTFVEVNVVNTEFASGQGFYKLDPMPFSFEVLATSGAARRGRITTAHGVIETPVFMPVGTLASIKGVPQHLLEELGVEILLGNTYHLYLRPGCDLIRSMGGLHRFMAWPRPILTDSGGFQVYSLSPFRKVSEEGVAFQSHIDGSRHFFTPEKSMDAQIALGADMIMAFDECTEYPATRQRVESSLQQTLRWARRSQQHYQQHRQETVWRSSSFSVPLIDAPAYSRAEAGPGPDQDFFPALFGIVQGGMHPDLRREASRQMVEMNFPGYALGGLSVGEPRELRADIVAGALEHLPPEKPRYVMGVGYPEEIVSYALLGVDMMDCVLPTRAARHGLLFTSEGRINIKNARFAADPGPLDPACACRVCGRYSRAYLRHLYVTGEALAGVLNTVHNLAYYLDTMRRVRQSINAANPSGDIPKAVSAEIPRR